MAHYLPIVMTTAVVLTSLLAIASFLLYNYKVGLILNIELLLIESLFQFHPWSILIQDPAASTTSPEEDIEYEDIYIPVPYDPKIPGVRCIDLEEDVPIVKIASDILDDEANLSGQETEGEAIELEDLGQDVNLADVGETETACNSQI